MELNEILESLCMYDKRNPDCFFDNEEIEDHNNQIKNKTGRIHNGSCSCDNCFYGRTKLAEYILKLMNYERTICKL